MKRPLVLGVSDGCGQSLSTRNTVRLHRRQIALEVPSPSEGKAHTHTHTHTLLSSHFHTHSLKTHTYSVSLLQYNAFFEFNDRLEAVMSKAYIYR